ncbi:MAG: hypothetical protein MUF71_06920 [Candidatus Kapabacteria bacterium]|jgi:hypothetical protein|nr:hypothetical protein [Candidatus Kapabacteria bacterium]
MNAHESSFYASSEAYSVDFSAESLSFTQSDEDVVADNVSSDMNDGSGAYSGGMPSHSLPFSAGGHDVLVQENILRDIISDEQYQSLRKLGLLNEKVLRDVHIRKTFRELRAQHLSAHQAIERLQTLYPYLQFDTLRKIVYQINDRS